MAHDWVAALAGPTTFQELRSVFGRILEDVASGVDPLGLAGALDEAVRRIGAEAARDQAALTQASADQAAFIKDNNGVGGWFKRHVPFTEAGKADREKKNIVADLKAQILADNLFLVRVLLLQERILPPPTRRLGLRPSDWTATFGGMPNLQARIAAFKLLTSQLADGARFLDDLGKHVEAARTAQFPTRENQASFKEELEAADKELKQALAELAEEQKIRAAELPRLAQILAAEMLREDGAMRENVARAAHLAELCGLSNSIEQGLGGLVATCEQLDVLQQERQYHPDRVKVEKDARDRAIAAEPEAIKTRNERLDQVRWAAQAVGIELFPEAAPWPDLIGSDQRAQTEAIQTAHAAAVAAWETCGGIYQEINSRNEALALLEEQEQTRVSEMASQNGAMREAFATLAANMATLRAKDVPHEAAAKSYNHLVMQAGAWLQGTGFTPAFVDALAMYGHDKPDVLRARKLLTDVQAWLSTRAADLTEERGRVVSQVQATWRAWSARKLEDAALAAEVAGDAGANLPM